MREYARLFAEQLDKEGIIYNTMQNDAGNDVVSIRYNGNNMNNIEAFLFFSDLDEVSVVVSLIESMSQAKRIAALEKVNEYNNKYKWARFQIFDDNRIVLAREELLNISNAVDACKHAMLRLMSIADESYPDFMKLVWS